MSPERIRDVLDGVRYKDWWIITVLTQEGVLHFNWSFRAPDAAKLYSSDKQWMGRTWTIRADQDESSIVKTAFLALKVALEREAAEAFSYNGTRVFDPHIDIHRLKTAAIGEARERADHDGRIHP